MTGNRFEYPDLAIQIAIETIREWTIETNRGVPSGVATDSLSLWPSRSPTVDEVRESLDGVHGESWEGHLRMAIDDAATFIARDDLERLGTWTDDQIGGVVAVSRVAVGIALTNPYPLIP